MVELQWHRFNVQECLDGLYEPRCVLQYRHSGEGEWTDVPVVDGPDIRYDGFDRYSRAAEEEDQAIEAAREEAKAAREEALERRCRAPSLNRFLDTIEHQKES